MAITLSTSAGPVVLKEMYEGYVPGMDIQRGPFVQKSYLCPSWNTSFACVNALMGTGSRPIQHACPESPNLRCMSAVIRPKGEYDVRDGGRPQFNMPIIDCVYAVPTWEAQTSDDPTASQSFPDAANPGQPYVFIEQTIDYASEIVKLPGRTYKFSDGTVNDTPVHVTIETAVFVLVRRWQTTLPYVNVTTYMNKLNLTTFLGQPKGQIKFLNARCRRQAQTDGSRSQEVEYRFKWRLFDHNMVIRGDTGFFDTLISASGGNPYKYLDLNALVA